MCEEHFSVKPSLSHLGCRQLLKISEQQQNPGKLLVHLSSEGTATDLLAEAKKLRRSDNSIIATSVYINPDRSPAKAKLAFERLQRKRVARQQQIQSTTRDIRHATNYEQRDGAESATSPHHGLPTTTAVDRTIPDSAQLYEALLRSKCRDLIKQHEEQIVNSNNLDNFTDNFLQHNICHHYIKTKPILWA